MLCEHLQSLDEELTRAGIATEYREIQPWSSNCRRWTRYACFLDLPSLRARLQLPACVVHHAMKANWQGEERGFVCDAHHDAIIGDYERRADRPCFK